MSSSQLRSHVQSLRSYEDCQQFRLQWDALVALHSGEINTLDPTSCFDWAMALWQSHLKVQDQEVLVLRQGDDVTGILPLYRFQKKVRGIPCRSVAPFTELYGGRTGFLLKDPRVENLDALLTHAQDRLPSWDTFVLTVVDGSDFEKLLLDLVSRKRWHFEILNKERSPFIPFLDTWENHFASLPKKLRSTMRNGEKRLRERGELTYKECRTLDEVQEFNVAVAAIERESWKAEAGTSIASNPVHDAFHRDLALRAAACGYFSGHLLLLNREPIAYIMGLLQQGVFLDLKESYRAVFREMSPGHVLKSFAFARLYEHGTHVYDFMGKCEEYKLKWTDQTYCRSTYLVFSNSWRSRIARWAFQLSSRKSIPSPPNAPPVQEGTGSIEEAVK
jgi:CelD/BcsL family acetyltransferase involved in cellulose biosynthesis